MASKLSLYNGALIKIGERSLASLTEARESRRALDEVYDGAVAFCLEQGQWNFAIRSIEAAASATILPPFGYKNAFVKPTDWVRTVGLCSDEYFSYPLLHYTDEGGNWYSETDPIYVRYVSNDANYGMNLAAWPATFAEYVEALLASRSCERISQNDTKAERLKKDVLSLATNARSKDAMNEATVFAPAGSWVSARGYGTRRGERAV